LLEFDPKEFLSSPTGPEEGASRNLLLKEEELLLLKEEEHQIA